MINPRLGILGALNPRPARAHKKGRKRMARRKSGRAHMAWVRSFKKGRKRAAPRKRRRTYRRNPVAANPSRPAKRRYYARHRRARRRGYRRNPAIMGFTLPPLQSVAYAAAGFVGTPMLEGFLSRFIPVEVTANTLGKYAVRIGSVLGLTYLAKTVLGRSQAQMVGIGGGAYVLVSAIREFAPTMIPGMSAYVTGGPSLSGYVNTRGLSGMGASPFGNGGAGIRPKSYHPARFSRF